VTALYETQEKMISIKNTYQILNQNLYNPITLFEKFS